MQAHLDVADTQTDMSMVTAARGDSAEQSGRYARFRRFCLEGHVKDTAANIPHVVKAFSQVSAMEWAQIVAYSNIYDFSHGFEVLSYTTPEVPAEEHHESVHTHAIVVDARCRCHG